MPKGQVAVVPDDGLSTRQRRNRPLLVVHTGQMKGKSTAAFGMAMRAWNQGWPIAVYQFVKSAKWKVGEESAFKALGELHQATGQGGPVRLGLAAELGMQLGGLALRIEDLSAEALASVARAA